MYDQAHAAKAYEELEHALRRLTQSPTAPVDVPAHFLASIRGLLEQAKISASGGPAAAAQGREQAKLLSRWLWNRGLTSDIMTGFSLQDRAAIEHAAGLGVVEDHTLWGRVLGLTRKVEAIERDEPGNPKVARHNMDEHAQWVPSVERPAASDETVTPIRTPAVDSFKYGQQATANRKAKAKTLARWLWDRNIDYEMFLNFTAKHRNAMARAAGVNPPSGMDSWEETFAMIAKMEARAAATPTDPATIRHALDEHDQWSVEQCSKQGAAA